MQTHHRVVDYGRGEDGGGSGSSPGLAETLALVVSAVGSAILSSNVAPMLIHQ